MKKIHTKSHKGFTLIELLVVVAIIGMLAGLMIVNLSIARQKSRDARRRADLKSLQTALEMYANDVGGYPTTNWGTEGGCAFSATCTSIKYRQSFRTTNDVPHGWGAWLIPQIAPQYLSVLPIDPTNNTTYYYYYLSDGTDYKLMANVMESPEGKAWAANDGGSANSVLNRNFCGGGTCPVTFCLCNYELFSYGGQNW